MLVLPIGLAAGALTTVAGVGGGMMMVLLFSVLWDPQAALATTAPALLLGNLHRLWLFRHELDRRVALAIAAGALPAAFAFGLLAVAVPDWVLHWLILGALTAALAQKLGWLRWTPGPKSFVPAGAAAGALTATTGGGGLVLAPLLLSAGLVSETYIATGAAVASTMHVGRIAAYGAGGLIQGETIERAALLAVALIAGNLLGRRARAYLSEPTKMRIAWGALFTAVTIAVVGVV